jgi:formate hydrogenlyase subunit 3/multisubunit Na+/H+ antiporter MnhD subunit
MDFFHVTKYPPSIAFLLLNLGVILLLLSLFARVGEKAKKWGRPLLVFGQSSLFFYLLHLYLYGIIGLFFAPQGTGILWMYVFWAVGLILLYPLCLKYGRFKRKKSPESIWRFF